MTLRDYTANVISASKVVPDGNFKDSKASGVWDINEALDLIKGGNWPNAANIDPAAFVDALFSTDLIVGATGTARTITNGIDLSTKKGFVWGAVRTTGDNRRLSNTVRGASETLDTGNTYAEFDNAGVQGATQFNSNGFVSGLTDSFYNNEDIVYWTFREQPKFFDLVQFSGTGSAQNISHSLGSVPGMIWVKRVDTTGDWAVYHRGFDSSAPEDYVAFLNKSDAIANNNQYWNDTAPTSSVFTVGTNSAVNASGGTYIAFIFAHNADSTDPVQTSLQGKTLSNLGSAFDGSYPITNINDGVAETSNANSIGYVSNADMDISVDYGSAVIVNAYYIAPQGDQGGSVYNTPTAFTAYGSNNGSSWTSLASFSSISGFAAGSYKEFTFSNTTAYRYYRLEVTASSASGVSISEWNVGIAPAASELGNFGELGDSNIIKCASFTGNSSADVTVDLGFEPQFLLTFRTGGSNWSVVDNLRGIVTGGVDPTIFADTGGAENTAANRIDLTPTGFIQKSGQTGNETVVYMAIRRGGMQTPTSASDVFQATASLTGARQNGDTITTTLDRADWHFARRTGTSYAGYNQTRITGWKYLMTNAADAESSATLKQGDNNNKLEYTGSWHNADNDVIDYFWKRAKGFLDIVTYTGTGSARTVSHNLGVVPEMMWLKRRNGTGDWAVYHASQGNTKASKLNTTDAFGTEAYFNSTTPTSSVFTLADFNDSGQPYIAFLMATAAGVSKVGSYTGNGSSQDIDCGFSGGNGASFVMIKNADATGNWVVFDTARGLVAGNDVYIRFDVTNAEGGGYDFIDPLESGFTINQTGGVVLNESGQEYIFWAIA
jgi:hypothetical protein